jgi:hypothetical protein
MVRKRAELAAGTVTVAVLSGVSAALAEHLVALGDDPSALGAEVPMAKPPPRLAYNHFGNVGVGLYPELAAVARSQRIADDLATGVDAPDIRDARGGSGLRRNACAVVALGDGAIRPRCPAPAVTGNTVVSSVNCGAADFAFGGAPVRWRGFAGVSPMMGLTHVVVGVGDTVTIGVHAAESAVGGPGGLDAYVARLEAALSFDLGAQPGDADVEGGLEVADVSGVEQTDTRPGCPPAAPPRPRWVDGPGDLALPLHRAHACRDLAAPLLDERRGHRLRARRAAISDIHRRQRVEPVAVALTSTSARSRPSSCARAINRLRCGCWSVSTRAASCSATASSSCSLPRGK